MANRYWVGGAGFWQDGVGGGHHWATTSGGSSGAATPTSADDVIFDANSGFTVDGQQVNLANGFVPTEVKSMNLSALNHTIEFINTAVASSAFNVYGNLIWKAGMVIAMAGLPINFKSTGAMGLTTNAATLECDLVLNATGTLTLNDHLIASAEVTLFLNKGIFRANAKNITINTILTTDYTSDLDVNFSTGTITTSQLLLRKDSGTIVFTLNLATYVFKTYNTANPHIDIGASVTLVLGNTTFDMTEDVLGTQSTFPVVARMQNIASDTGLQDMQFGTLTIVPPDYSSMQGSVWFPSGKTVTASAVVANGNASHQLYFLGLDADANPAQATLSTAAFTGSYITPTNITAANDIPFDDTVGGLDGGSNTDWLFGGVVPGVLPTYKTGLISALARVDQNYPQTQFVFGGVDEDGNHALFKKSSSYSFSMTRFKFPIGQPFDLERIRFPVFPAITGDMQLIAKLYFDNETSSAVSNVINATTYPDAPSVITLYADNFDNAVHGENDLIVEFQSIGGALATIGLSIEIDIDEHETV